MKSTVQEISLQECRHNFTEASLSFKRYKINVGITDSLLCAKNRKHYTDTCQGNELILHSEYLDEYLFFSKMLG